MARTIWPGLAVSVLLGMAFCLFDFAPQTGAKSAGTSRAPKPARAVEATPSPATPVPELPLRPRPAAPPPLVTEAPAAPFALPPPPALAPTPVFAAPPAPGARARSASQNGRRGGKSPMLPLRRMLMGAKAGRADGAPAVSSVAVSSGAALASLGSGTIDPAWDYYDLPARGIEVWADAALFSEKQKLRDAGRTFYDQDGVAYSVGIKRDWSIDSVIGLSLDILDSELESNLMLDYRKNDIAGYRVNAHYEGVAFDRLTFDVRGFYGRLDHKGDGYLSIHHQGNAWREEWKEDKHRSETYGFAGKIGLPLLWGPDVKVLPEIGVNFTKLKTDSYAYALTSIPNGARAPKTSSTSIEIPLAVTLRKDFLQCWGIVTPKLGLSYTLELDDGAAGVRAYNSSAASHVLYDPATNSVSGFSFDDSQKAFMRVDVGMEVMTVGGWKVNAEYSHVFAEKYNNDTFRLELGRCF